MMREYIANQTRHGFSDWSPVDRRGSSGDDYLVVVEILGDMIVDFEFSPERPANSTVDIRPDPTTIIQHDVLKDLTESCASTMIVPFQSFRINVKVYNSGTVSATVVQGGHHGH